MENMQTNQSWFSQQLQGVIAHAEELSHKATREEIREHHEEEFLCGNL